MSRCESKICLRALGQAADRVFEEGKFKFFEHAARLKMRSLKDRCQITDPVISSAARVFSVYHSLPGNLNETIFVPEQKV